MEDIFTHLSSLILLKSFCCRFSLFILVSFSYLTCQIKLFVFILTFFVLFNGHGLLLLILPTLLLDIHFQSSHFATDFNRFASNFIYKHTYFWSLFEWLEGFPFWRKRSGSIRFWCIHFTPLSDITRLWPMKPLKAETQEIIIKKRY